MQPTDAPPQTIALSALVARAQAGDLEAFDALYARTVGRVYALCLRMSGSAPEAERLTQDAFVRAWSKLSSFRGEADFASWLHRLAVNVVLQDRRGAARRGALVEYREDPELLSGGTTADPGSRLDLERAIARLPAGARAALVLHDIEGYRHEEIARMSGIAPGTVKAQLHRARRLLRAALGS